MVLTYPLGQAEDQVCAGPLAVLLCVQLGYGSDSEDIFKLLKSPLLATLQDPTAKVSARASVSSIVFFVFFIKFLFQYDTLNKKHEFCFVKMSLKQNLPYLF